MTAPARISHQVIKVLYEVLGWYQQNRGAGRAAVVLNYYSVWRSLHVLTVNISDEAWDDICGLAKSVGVDLSGGKENQREENKWLFLFAVETYLHLFIRSVALSKLGSAPQSLQDMWQKVNSARNIFAPSVFEWVFEAYSDQTLDPNVKGDFMQSIDLMLQVIYNLNISALTVDVFRELYQSILPKSMRRSLGEFYTSEDLVDEVLNSAGFDASAVAKLYERWKEAAGGVDKPLVLDPACGSGTFLIRAVKRLFEGLRGAYGKCPPDVASFVEETVVGIDINPFAVEMAKLNVFLAVSEEMDKCGMKYLPRSIRIYWADSLSLIEESLNVLGGKTTNIKVPVLAQEPGGGSGVRIPILPGVSTDELVNVVYNTVRSGKSFEDVRRGLEVKAGANAVKRVEKELRDLFDALSKIEKEGNARVAELIKNATIVVSLLGKCDCVFGNPPWVRIHRVAQNIVKMLRENYAYYGKGSVYDPKFKKTKTPFKELHDYSVAFVERGLQFLREGGVLGYVITSKVLKAMYAGRMREDIVSNYKVLKLVDYSLYPVPLFQDAVNYPLIIAVKKEKPEDTHVVEVTVYNTVGDSKTFKLSQNELPLDQNDRKSPWVLAPPKVVKALRKVNMAALRLGDVYEVVMGVMTSADEIYVGKLTGCSSGLARLALGNGQEVDVEVDLLHPFVRGKGVDPFSYEFDEYIVFTHDTASFKPLWDVDQERVLEHLGLLSWNVRAVGGVLAYTVETTCGSVDQRVKSLVNLGFTVNLVSPCTVYKCYEITRGGVSTLRVNLESASPQECRVYVEGLRIPGRPYATKHFLTHLGRLVKRDDYRSNMPPWVIFRVSPNKFRDYRIAWQEIAKHFEACVLPVWIKTSICGIERNVLMVPSKTVYFVVEPDLKKALKLLLYLNSGVVRSLLKLSAWTVRGGHYRHLSACVGHLPIPHALLKCGAWKIVEKVLTQHSNENLDLNATAKELLSRYGNKLEDELKQILDIADEEYEAIVEYGEWLNELGEARIEKEKAEAEEEEQPEETS
ncbi:MAG: N-6 DNA methylase [Zestosphaera sp.]